MVQAWLQNNNNNKNKNNKIKSNYQMYRFKIGKEVPPFVEKTKIVVSLDIFYVYERERNTVLAIKILLYFYKNKNINLIFRKYIY